jgi:hypothetical protein
MSLLGIKKGLNLVLREGARASLMRGVVRRKEGRKERISQNPFNGSRVQQVL